MSARGLAKLKNLLHTFGRVQELRAENPERPIHGTVMYLARCSLETRSGIFKAFVFQDLITKGYVIAVTRGKLIGKKPLLTRIHSSCVTSETLRSLDSDDIQQLEAAIDAIAKHGRGILFYLIQEGRGVGFIAKARDRMIVQASRNKISTHEAFTLCGLEGDYRDYRSIPSICNLLGITAPFTILSNNPEKLEALRSLGLNIAGAERLEVTPGPHNIAYLNSKADAGHKLSKAKSIPIKSALPPDPIKPFRPYAIKSALRFIHAASYLLPMKPVDGEIILHNADWKKLSAQINRTTPKSTIKKLIKHTQTLPLGRTRIKIDRTLLKKHRSLFPDDPITSLLSIPYWFKIHAYHDISSSEDFIVLEYGDVAQSSCPVVRIQSESLINRFPLENVENRDKFKGSVRQIVEHGHGIIVLLHNDGRGAGFGAYATDLMFMEERVTPTSEASYEKMGLHYDLRDYGAAVQLVKHHVGSKPIAFISSSAESLAKKPETILALGEYGIAVQEWIFLSNAHPILR